MGVIWPTPYKPLYSILIMGKQYHISPTTVVSFILPDKRHLDSSMIRINMQYNH